jgi:transketolase
MNGARFAYLERLCEISATADANGGAYFVSCDFAAPVFDRFRTEHPERYISVGIAEQNMISVACGLALSGKRAVAYSPSPFPITRAFDQIRCAACGMGLPITIATHGRGFAQPYFGPTHFNTEELSLLRSLPNVKAIFPTDSAMGIAAADYTLAGPHVTYISFDALCGDAVYGGGYIIDFSKGFAVLHGGFDVAVMASGGLVPRLLELAERWESMGIGARVIDLYALPFDTDALLDAIGDLPLVTIEEHVLAGGMGSAMLELFNDRGKGNRLIRKGVDFRGGYPHSSGGMEYFLGLYGLGDESMTEAVREAAARPR